MPLRARLVAALVSILPCTALEHASAQSIEYDVTILGEVPGSYITYCSGMNDYGEVVGMALFLPGGLKAYRWTESQGYVLLPQAPIADFGAVDINNAGDIAGDGGGDSGQIWRYTGGTYEMLGVLPGLPIPQAVGISATGSVAGTCFGSQFYNPHHSFIAVSGSPLVSILDNSNAYDINDSDQITGRDSGNVAYRSTPGLGIQLLPPLGGRFLTGGYGINNAGNVVGVAASTAQHSDVPFFFSDAGGMLEIGNFGGRAFARDINDQNEVAGEWEPSSGTWAGVRRSWVWSSTQGVRMLDEVIDSALNVHPKNVRAINNVGQILCRGRANNENVPLLLTPRVTNPDRYCDPSALGTQIDIDTTSLGAGSINLTYSGGTPGLFGYLLIGSGSGVSNPAGALGSLCLNGAPIGRYIADLGVISAGGTIVTDLLNGNVGGGVGSLPSPPNGTLAVGQTWNFQYWARHAGVPSTFSDALSVTFTN